MVSHYLNTALGGALGAVTRIIVGKMLPGTIIGMPCYILLVNVLGCLLMGLLTALMTLSWSIPDNMRYFLISGFLGGFTTFSGFVLEFSLLCEKNQVMLAIIYLVLTMILTILSFFLGFVIVKMVVIKIIN